MRINLEIVRDILTECTDLVEALDGEDLDETDAVKGNPKGQRPRQEKAEMSRKLNLLADRLTFGSTLVRNEYWAVRGEFDHLGLERDL